MDDKPAIDDGGQAFPCMYPNANNLGMTLRDYFAAHANESDVAFWLRHTPAIDMTFGREAAKYAYADAMLAAQKANTKSGAE